jgi:hypothetical protein
LRFDRFEGVQTESDADQNSSKNYSDMKVTSHGTWFFLRRQSKNNPDAIGAQKAPKSYSHPEEAKKNSKSPHARQAHAGFAF